jgi:formylglycine-generating enzyme required for sulfatase activity
MQFVLIPEGEFLMSAPPKAGQLPGDDQISPAHKVRVTKPFNLGRHEVTVRQWIAVMGEHASECEGQADSPVTGVGPRDCLQFCHQMSAKPGKRFRLPTEAGWERACRAGTDTEYSFGRDPDALGRYAWFSDNSGDQTQPVGEKLPNPWGLYDMHGNAGE